MPDTTTAFDVNQFIKPFDYASQGQQTQDFLGAEKTAIPRLQKETENSLNIPEFRNQVVQGTQGAANTNLAMTQLPDTIKASTMGSLVNEGQRQNMIAKQSVPLTRQLEAQNASIAGATAGLTNATNAYTSKITQAMLPWEQGFNDMQVQQARQFSGYTTQNQLELDRLIANQKAGLQWTTDEANRANALAVAEKQYQSSLFASQAVVTQAQIAADAKKYEANLPYKTGIYPAGTNFTGITF